MHKNNQPLVSIIISCYNAEMYVAATLESVLGQTYPSMEIIVINDGSTDGSKVILENYANKGIKVYHTINRGQDAALNTGFMHANGTFIKFMDADDIINPQMIEMQMKHLAMHPTKVAYSEWYRFFGDVPRASDEAKKMDYWKDASPLDFLLEDQDGPMLQCGIMMMHRTLIEKAGLWDERLILYNDTEFFTRVILASDGVAFTPGAKLYYRSGLSTSLTSQPGRKYFESTFLASQLIKDKLLSIENSPRVRRVLANIFWRRRYDMYPHFPDLAILHEEQCRQLGGSNLKIKGGKLYNLIDSLFGWKAAKRFQLFLYANGYLWLLKHFRKNKTQMLVTSKPFSHS